MMPLGPRLILGLLLAVHGAADCPASTRTRKSFRVNFSGLPTTDVRKGFFPHGDPNLSGTGYFVFDTNDNTMDWSIQLGHATNYVVTQAHLYNLELDKSGDSWSCWGGRWSKHSFLHGTDFDTYIDVEYEILKNPKKWVVMLHTEGGHFALDERGDLVVYNPYLHETSVTGVKEKKKRFNNRVPRKLTNRRLRELNPVSGGFGDREFDTIYPKHHFDRTNDKPFPDASGNEWIVWDNATQTYVPSEYGTSHNLTADDITNKEYLFYLYDDQGPEWDYGGPEGAGGGVLIPCD